MSIVNKKYITKSAKQTQKLGRDLAKNLLSYSYEWYNRPHSSHQAVVLGLTGNLGGGKTTFLQGFAAGLGIKEKILSPTFVIQKKFEIRNSKFANFYHIDCYRLKNEKDILELGFKKIISDPKNIVAIEWPEKIKKALQQNTIFINFKFIKEDKREISFEM